MWIFITSTQTPEPRAATTVARQANINQVASYIAAFSQGNAVLTYGDTNGRYSRAADTAIRSLIASTSGTSFGMRDA